MTARKKNVTSSKHQDPWEWVKLGFMPMIGLVGGLVAFYFYTNATLKEHEHQFAEVGKKFDQFNATLKQNYEDYAKNQKDEVSNRDKLREQFMSLINKQTETFASINKQLSSIDAQTAVQGERYNNLKSQLDTIQTYQQRVNPPARR